MKTVLKLSGGLTGALFFSLLIPYLLFADTSKNIFKPDLKKAGFHSMKNTVTCNKIKKKFNSVSSLPIKISYKDISDLILDALVEGCWNKSKACWYDAQKLAQVKVKLYNLFPLHPLNNPNWNNWSEVDKLRYKEIKEKADVNLLTAYTAFEKSCKRNFLTNFLDNFR